MFTSYSDIKYGKIRNKHLSYAFLYSFIFNIVIAFQYNVSIIPLNRYYIDLLVNVIISAIFGFLLWHLMLWSSGDGKLLTAYSALIPLSAYSIGYIQWFPSFVIFLNTFLLGALYITFNSLFFTSHIEKMTMFKTIFNLKGIINFLLFLFGFLWVIGHFFRALGLPSNIVVFLIVFFLILKVAGKFINLGNMAVFLSALRIALSLQNFMLFQNTVHSLLFEILPLVMTIRFIYMGGFFTANKMVGVHNLLPRMILGEKIVPSGEKFVKKPIRLSIMSKPPDDEGQLFEYNIDGLTPEDIESIMELKKQNKLGFDCIYVHRTIPFALMMFLGVLLTLLAQGNLIIFFNLII